MLKNGADDNRDSDHAIHSSENVSVDLFIGVPFWSQAGSAPCHNNYQPPPLIHGSFLVRRSSAPSTFPGISPSCSSESLMDGPSCLRKTALSLLGRSVLLSLHGGQKGEHARKYAFCPVSPVSSHHPHEASTHAVQVWATMMIIWGKRNPGQAPDFIQLACDLH
jgi:hypothetical protein